VSDRLLDDVGSGPVGVDACAFVYFVEEHAVYAPVVAPLFEAFDAGTLNGVTSGVTLLEVLVVPLRAGNEELAGRYEAILRGSRGLAVAGIDPALLRTAAGIRAATGVRTPDALQLAAALHHGATAFVTNDRRLPRLGSLRIVQLRDHVAGGADPGNPVQAAPTAGELLVEQGRRQGFEQALRETLVRLLALRFGELSDETAARIRTACTGQLQDWTDRIATAGSPAAVFAD